MTYHTEQENFWAGEFGLGYMERNQGEKIVLSNLALFAQILKSAPGIKSIVELGCNIGLNLKALHRINPDFFLCGYEINSVAAEQAKNLGIADIVCSTILDPADGKRTFDLAFTKGVLIHINPDELDKVYANLYMLSRRYIMVCEYYNPVPVTVPYRGNTDRLFKRDFAGEMIDRYHLRLIDYGFVYHRDGYFPQDDVTWFLMEK
jgi:pseudaminic acid biosynthesis-associated methylase